MSVVAVGLVVAVSTMAGHRASGVEVPVGPAGTGSPGAGVLAALLLIAVIGGWAIHDDLGMDSTALWLHLSSGARGRDDRLGRAVALMAWQVPLVLAVGLGLSAWSGAWYALPAVLGLTAALDGAALAWSSVMSVLLPYETNPPGESPLRSRTSGTAFVAVLVQMAGLLVVVAAALPAVAGLIAGAVTGAWGWGWVLLVGGVAWGAGLSCIGVVQGGRLLDARGARVLATVRTWPGHELT
ncbi:hypothetical protein [Actinomyces haliotis]|uniref:hypothetical protein n=1 Tax=Actinomyces haliotis TaxID=1280843 RepID=UPI001E5AA91A|nr:hypothetical protein [Actinomyces haliotis]